MDYTKETCSRELAEEMARLGICQDGAELFYCLDKDNPKHGWELAYSYNKDSDSVVAFIAPTLSRMMEELLTKDESCFVGHDKDGFFVEKMNKKELLIDWVISDINLPKAIAKALIVFKKGNV